MITNKMLKDAGIRVPLLGSLEFKQLERKLRTQVNRKRWGELHKLLVKASHVNHADAFRPDRLKTYHEKCTADHIGARAPCNVAFNMN